MENWRKTSHNYHQILLHNKSFHSAKIVSKIINLSRAEHPIRNVPTQVDNFMLSHYVVKESLYSGWIQQTFCEWHIFFICFCQSIYQHTLYWHYIQRIHWWTQTMKLKLQEKKNKKINITLVKSISAMKDFDKSCILMQIWSKSDRN